MVVRGASLAVGGARRLSTGCGSDDVPGGRWSVSLLAGDPGAGELVAGQCAGRGGTSAQVSAGRRLRMLNFSVTGTLSPEDSALRLWLLPGARDGIGTGGRDLVGAAVLPWVVWHAVGVAASGSLRVDGAKDFLGSLVTNQRLRVLEAGVGAVDSQHGRFVVVLEASAGGGGGRCLAAGGGFDDASGVAVPARVGRDGFRLADCADSCCPAWRDAGHKWGRPRLAAGSGGGTSEGLAATAKGVGMETVTCEVRHMRVRGRVSQRQIGGSQMGVLASSEGGLGELILTDGQTFLHVFGDEKFTDGLFRIFPVRALYRLAPDTEFDTCSQ